MNAAQPTPEGAQPHPVPPRFRRWEEALYWLSDQGWRQVDVRGSHFRLQHPSYSKAMFLIYKRGTSWGPFQQLQIEKNLRKLDRDYRRPDSG